MPFDGSMHESDRGSEPGGVPTAGGFFRGALFALMVLLAAAAGVGAGYLLCRLVSPA